MEARVRLRRRIGFSAHGPRSGRGGSIRVAEALVIALLTLLAGACGAGATPTSGEVDSSRALLAVADTPAVPDDAPLVIFLGDSLSAGLHVDPEDAFPAVLARRLADEQLPIRIVNAGVSGDTTAGGLARVDWLLKQEPALLVVELGGNDGLRGQPLATVEANLRGILVRARAAGATPLLMGMDVPPSYGREYADGFSALYGRLAEELDVPLVPRFLEGVGGVPDLNFPDGIHPTPAGHERLAENVLPVLRAQLEASSD